MASTTAYSIADIEFDCKCTNQVFVKYTKTNGIAEARKQCTTCGKGIAVKKSESPVPIESLPEFNKETRDRWYEARRKRMQQIYEQEKSAKDQEWQLLYSEYMVSDEWRERRQKVLVRDKWTCQSCLKARATQVHHLTYKHVFQEPLFDLISVCFDCHQTITELDSARRQ
jgi:5-methylcytosine-specific restriction endonuclease McrA